MQCCFANPRTYGLTIIVIAVTAGPVPTLTTTATTTTTTPATTTTTSNNSLSSPAACKAGPGSP